MKRRYFNIVDLYQQLRTNLPPCVYAWCACKCLADVCSSGRNMGNEISVLGRKLSANACPASSCSCTLGNTWGKRGSSTRYDSSFASPRSWTRDPWSNPWSDASSNGFERSTDSCRSCIYIPRRWNWASSLQHTQVVTRISIQFCYFPLIGDNL